MKNSSIKKILRNAKEQGRKEVIEELLKYIKPQAIACNKNIEDLKLQVEKHKKYHLEHLRNTSEFVEDCIRDINWFTGARASFGLVWGKIHKIRKWVK